MHITGQCMLCTSRHFFFFFDYTPLQVRQMQHTTEIVLVAQAIVIIKKRFFMTVCKNFSRMDML